MRQIFNLFNKKDAFYRSNKHIHESDYTNLKKNHRTKSIKIE